LKDFIYPEMMVHVPLCTHKEPKNILVLSNDAMKLQLEVARHNEISATSIPATIDALRGANDNSFDVILSELPCDAAVIAHLARALNENGLLMSVHPSLDNVVENKIIMEIMAKYFKIIMPCRLEDGTTLLLASKAYHPTADLILHRADMLDGVSYYNCDIHPASFAMGTYIRKEYLGVIKN
jgi:spermidine synthase